MSRPIVTLTQRTRRYQQGLGGLVDAMPGSVITEGKKFPEHSLIIGSPARVVRTLEPAQVAAAGRGAKFYVLNGARFKKGMKQIG